MVGLGKFTIPYLCKLNDYSNGRRTFTPFWCCSHGCVYCYLEYGFRYLYWRAKSEDKIVSVDLERTTKDYLKLPSNTEIEASPSCDAFDKAYEKKHKLTYRFLKEIVPLRSDVFLTFITKSNLINEYSDLIPEKQSIIQISVESYGEKLKSLSPNASSYKERLECVKDLVDKGLSVGLRIDPIIPAICTNKNDIKKIMNDFINAGIKHITCSFVKLNTIQIKKLSENFGWKLENYMYRKHKNEYFFNDELRKEYATMIKERCSESNITFAMCREIIVKDTGLCDPFHLLPNYKRKPKIKAQIYKKLTDF
jgi:DNA repair photolyase